MKTTKHEYGYGSVRVKKETFERLQLMKESMEFVHGKHCSMDDVVNHLFDKAQNTDDGISAVYQVKQNQKMELELTKNRYEQKKKSNR